MTVTAKKVFFFNTLFLIALITGSGISIADTKYNSEVTSADGSKSQLTMTLYDQITSDMRVGHYSGSHENRFVGVVSRNGTVFEGYWVQESSGRECAVPINGSNFYGRVFFKLESEGFYSGGWGYCNENPVYSWQAWEVGSKNSNTPTKSNSPTSTKVEIQKALNFFGYNAGTPDGVFGRKTKNAVAKIQMCWEDADPYAQRVEGTLEIGVLSKYQGDFLLRSHAEAQNSGIKSADCLWFKQLVSGRSESEETYSANEGNDSFCDYEGDVAEPVFYCTVNGKKSIKICESYSDKGEWNSFNYSFGKIGEEPELEITEEMTKSYFPAVVSGTSIEMLMPSCTDQDGAPCETNHSVQYDFNDTRNLFRFQNGGTVYLLSTQSLLLARDRVYEGQLEVFQNSERVAALECDYDTVTKNSVWDGSYVDTIIKNSGLCFVNMGEPNEEWQQCLP